MRKLLEHKLDEFVAKRKYAETDQRKRLIDFEVVGYLDRRTKDINEWMESYDYYVQNSNRKV